MDIALALWLIDPTAEYVLDDSANPTKILIWRGKGKQPTSTEMEKALTNYHPVGEPTLEERVAALEARLSAGA